MSKYDRIWTGVHLFTAADGDGELGIVTDGALAVKDGRIAWMGPSSDLLGSPSTLATEVREGEGAWLSAGFIDCHTHLVFGGNRADEFARRLAGESYESVAKGGGGIRSTVRHTREASEEDLYRTAEERLRGLLAEGVTTVEVKSGYGLDMDTEKTMLRVARALGSAGPATVRTTFLGAHALPPEFEGRREAYLGFLVDEVLPAIVSEGLADQADAFLESIAFTEAECASVLVAAQALGLSLRLHADQLSDGGGAALAAALGARSADHLEYTSDEGARAMGKSGVTAVLLPGAFYSVGAEQPPPVAAFRSYGVPMAVATDLNPGSSPLRSLLLAMNMACTLFGLTPAEAVAGVTRHAAGVLDLEDRGYLAVGMRADLALWSIDHPRELPYWMGGNPCVEVVVEGEPVLSHRR